MLADFQLDYSLASWSPPSLIDSLEEIAIDCREGEYCTKTSQLLELKASIIRMCERAKAEFPNRLYCGKPIIEGWTAEDGGRVPHVRTSYQLLDSIIEELGDTSGDFDDNNMDLIGAGSLMDHAITQIKLRSY